ncbi:MAG: hypothetical protein NT031_17930, partial [Planctomycetota bacterium]|nr:hypothetical protein [Planctomycetota bacterium]
LVAAMLAADMSTDSSYMLTWGSVIYNDILAPFRKKRPPVSEKRGILYNRLIVALIGVFLLIYGLWFEMKGNLWDYLTITGTIYLASMSVLLVACCYWKRANNWGAAAAILVGAVIPVAFLVLERNWLVTDSKGADVSWLSAHGITNSITGLASLPPPNRRPESGRTPWTTGPTTSSITRSGSPSRLPA